jgi:LuxR family maltose regulon positive regulatory protein
MEYLLETNREKQCLEQVREFVGRENENSDADQLLGLIGVLGKLYGKGLDDGVYEEVCEKAEEKMRTLKIWNDWENLEVCRIYHESKQNSQSRLAYWLQYEAPPQMKQITYRNVYRYLMKAKGLLRLGQYAKAYPLFEELVLFYKEKNKPMRLIESLFGGAVALYAMNRQAEALKQATQALTIGVKYHYIGVYCEYGTLGYELIQLFQSMIDDGSGKYSGGRKKYYYGNILKASYEEYQAILLRCAKKGAKQSEKDIDIVQESLTTTELLVLKCVSDGMTNQETADEMHIKLQTVKTHLYSIYRKLGVKSRVAAVNQAKENGML